MTSASRLAFDETFNKLNQPGSPFEVGKRLIAGREQTAYINAPSSLRDMLDAGRKHGDLEYILYEGERLSFDAFYERADRLANSLINSYSVKKGSRVAIVMRNYPEWLIAFTAIVSTGATAVPLNSWGQAQEIHQNLKDAEASVVICDEKRLMLMELDELDASVIVARSILTQLPEGCQHFNDVVASGAPEPVPPVEIDGDDEAMIMFTSGTTGRAKGAIFSHHNCCQTISNFEACGATYYMVNIAQFQAHGEQGFRNKVLMAFPLFHVSGLFTQFISSLRNGGGVVMMYKWDPDQALRFIREERATMFSGAPTMLIDLFTHPDFNADDAASMGNVGSGGQALPAAVSGMIVDKLKYGIPGTGWGMTETTATGAQMVGSIMTANPGSAGLPAPILEMKFCDEDGNEVGADSPGEIWVRGPTVVSGYCNAPEANANEFVDGWFKTGDIGYLDENGFLFICDRAKDMVIRGGENIYPLEVEHCIFHMDAVKAVVAFGVHSERFGEELVAVVIPEDGATVTEEQIKQHCRENLAAFKVPSAVKFTDEAFPVNPSGKVLKKSVKAAFFA